MVVQNDLSPLWELDLNGKVNGAVLSSFIRKDEHSMSDYNCSGKRYSDYLNFSNPLISANFEFDRCAWLYGMNVFDLKAWRSTNITQVYHSWLKLVSSLSKISIVMFFTCCAVMFMCCLSYAEPKFWLCALAF